MCKFVTQGDFSFELLDLSLATFFLSLQEKWHAIEDEAIKM